MDGEALRAVRDAIGDHGPISFDEYMQLALYGSGGFYTRSPVGADGAFVTSPHVHPVFGRLLGRALRELWQGLGGPSPVRLAEVGAGAGTLTRQLLEELADLPVAVSAVETDPTARAALATIDGVDVVRELPMGTDLVVANELVDNLPFRVLRRGKEVRVGLDRDRLVTVDVEPGPDLLAATHGSASGDLDELVIPVGAFRFLDDLARALHPRGYALLIDYGTAGPSGAVHGYRDHHVVEDVLASPGESDITAGVDFDALAERARGTGLVPLPMVTQHDALMALGLDGWLRDELTRQHRELDERAGAAAVRTWSGRSRATMLADPGGLGRFRWLVLATPGLPTPGWLRRAADAGRDRAER
jgi:SAM-dependent MidA family methyltransferase